MHVTWKRSRVEKYNWLFFDFNSAWGISLLFTLVVIVLGIGLFILYSDFSNDLAPDSFAGYIYAIVGALFILLAALSYSRYRRSRKRGVGRLNGALHWHIGFGMIALGLLLLHSFGNFNPRSGTYALYSMIALVISGIIGRVLDHIAPKLVAHEVKHVLAAWGEDRVEFDTRTISSTVSHNRPGLYSFEPQRYAKQSVTTQAQTDMMTPWDLAYIALEEAPRNIDQRHANYYSAPDNGTRAKKMPDLQAPLEESPRVRGALHREEYYLALIRYWRVIHIALVFVTLGLILWHLEFAATLLLPMFF